MLDVISGALSSLQAATGITKGMLELKESVAVNTKAAELLGVIADVQMRLIEAQSQIHTLQREIAERDEALKKRTDFTRYEPFEPYPGTILYRLKSSETTPDAPAEIICPVCMEDGQKGLLAGNIQSYYHLTCTRCKRTYEVNHMAPMTRRTHNPYA